MWYPYVIGFIGPWGAGKSLSTALVSLIDHMIRGVPVWSNMEISCELTISDAIAQAFGIDVGGKVKYEALQLDKEKLMAFDPIYHDGCLVIEELNLEYAEARKSLTNTNLFFNRLNQEIRHRRLSMLYNVIHEMWIDNRVRGCTGVFVKCQDQALTPNGLIRRMQPGTEVTWKIYEMVPYLTGIPYTVTHKPLPTRTLHARRWWGLYSTWATQAEGGIDYNVKLGQSKESNDWGWLVTEVTDFIEDCATPESINKSHIRETIARNIDRDLTKGEIDKIGSQMKLAGYKLSRWTDAYELGKRRQQHEVLV